jgi:hypothetical protein
MFYGLCHAQAVTWNFSRIHELTVALLVTFNYSFDHRFVLALKTNKKTIKFLTICKP